MKKSSLIYPQAKIFMKKIIFALIILIVIAAAAAAAAFVYDISTPVDRSGADAGFVIEKGDGVKAIGAKLKAAGFIRSRFMFETYVWLLENESKFQAGVYALSPKLSAEEIVRVFVKGKAVNREREIKLIEGWTNREIGFYLEKEKIMAAKDFSALAGPESAKSFQGKFSFLSDKPAGAGLEGYLFPDTYRIFKDAGGEDVVARLLGNFDRKLEAGMRAEIGRQGKSIFEIVTMASIIEKEVRKTEDMKIVSGIFWNRIRNGQPLQSCATLAYILGVNKPQYTLEDTKTESPYNTYKYPGLTPGPIANPGLNAIEAAIYPAATDYNYFLSDPKTGATVFSRAYDEHVRNKEKYLD